MEARSVVVIGGGLAGMAAAARLAKNGHRVELYERSDRLGSWRAAHELDSEVTVDDAPSVIGFPAPWRDLFRKSGRPLEAELARVGFALEPAHPPHYRFADGTELALPADRGEEYQALEVAYGTNVATRWRELIDSFGPVWQALRPLGLEAEFPAPTTGPWWRRRASVDRATRRQLKSRQTVADLAESAPHPQLGALIRSIAHRSGSAPEQTPAMVAVELWKARTFNRWQIVRVADPKTSDAGRSSVLVELLASRLNLRRVEVSTGLSVTAVVNDGTWVQLDTSDGPRTAAAVVATTDPWSRDGWPGTGDGSVLTTTTTTASPALAPTVTYRETDDPPELVSETVTLDHAGVPVVDYARPLANRTLRTRHDFTQTFTSAAHGTAWQGFQSWLDRPPISGDSPRFFSAGPWSHAGPGSSSEVLSGALAAYACHALLTET